jgi:hypothetical protein
MIAKTPLMTGSEEEILYGAHEQPAASLLAAIASVQTQPSLPLLILA